MVNPDAATIARECKALQPTLKEYIQKRDPWDRDVEIQRRALQKQFLLLLLNHPYAKESRDTETHLWMQTSYALITSYKARISNLEQALREAGTQRQQGKQQRHGPVEYRKVIQRFKQFLATDEKFWTQLIVRLHSQFVLNEADSALIALHITVSDEPDPKGGATDDSRRERSGHFQFPIEPTEAQPPATPTQRANRLATLSKALVCLGDLARYREQYSEPGHRKQDESSKRGGRRGGGRQNQASIEVKMKTYDKARACYERARNLVPDEGNASHQLAILSAYQKDTFECIVHYYRAFCVRVSYDPVTVNMGNVLSRFLRSWKGKQSKNTAVDHGGGQSKQRLSSLKENVIALHALWNQKGADALGQFPDLEAHVVSEFQSLVTDRALPADVITKIVLLAQGAHWYHKESTSQSTANTSDATASILDRIAMHMLQLYTSLYEVGIHELKESSNIPEDDLAMRITAVLRRTLPALRIIGKWLRANMAIFQSIGLTIVPPPTLHTFRSALSTFGDLLVFTFPPSRLSKLNRPLEEDLELAGYLPLGGLLMDSATRDPEDTRALEEVHPNEEQLMRIWDVYQDVSRLNDDRRPDVQRHSFRTQHRNRSSAEEETISLDIPDPQRPADEIKPVVSWQISKKVPQDDDARTETTDPVGDAFRQALLASDSDSERDEIVWNPRPSRSPSSTLLPKPGAPQSAVSTHNPATGRVLSSQVQAPIGPNYGAAAQPSSHSATAAVVSPGPPTMQPHTPKTTAQDLLANVLGTGKTPSSRPRYVSQATPIVPSPLNPIAPPPEPTALPQPHLLFGGTSPTAASFGPGQSIWSASADEGSLGVHRRRASHSGFQPPASIPRAAPSFLPPTQSPWSGSPDRSIPAHTQRLHPQLGVNASFSPNNLPQIGGHRRVPSSTLPSSASYPAHPAGYGNLDMRTLDSRHPTSSIGLPPLLDGMHISTNDVPSASTYPSVRSGMTPLGARPPPQHGLPTANAGGVGTLAYGALSGTPQHGGPWHMG